MKNELVYLKENVMLEPLCGQWYAWSYLIPPATAAMYIANLHLRVMRSFVAAPQSHAVALQDPEMRGGPFMNLDVDRVEVVRALIERTEKEQAPMLELAEAIKSLEKTLLSEAKGSSLQPLYAKVPEILKGYVELVYDLNNQPSIRFIEGLLYRSPFYNPFWQRLKLSLIEQDERPFVFSTPRLEENGGVYLDIPFSSAEVDELFSMRHTPRPINDIKERLGVKDKDNEHFSSFFTTERSPSTPRYDRDGISIRYLGHACVLIESRETSILCDPVISYRYDAEMPRYTLADLPEHIDYVLITHNHQDHCMFETLLQLRHKVKNLIIPRGGEGGLADPSLKLILQQTGFKNVIEIDELEAISIDGGEIIGIPFPGEHGDLNIRTKIAYRVTLKGKSVMFVADSNNLEPKLYEHIHDLFGDVEVLFIGMECDGAPMSWLYGPLITKPLARKMDQSRRFDGSNYERAIAMVNQLNPKEVYVYAMGQEPWLTFLTSIQYTAESRPIIESDKLVAECTQRGIISERLYGSKQIH